MNIKKPLFKILIFSIYFLLLSTVFAKLFFEKQFDAGVNYLKSLYPSAPANITIGLSEPLISLNPLANDTGSRARLFHIYEGLVSVTPDLAIEPGLAVSYGSLDDLTWEFRLRPDVLFHDGTKLTIEDVIFSLEAAKNNVSSEVRDLMAEVQEIKKIDNQILRITTEMPDPLLLQKLSSILIFPKNFKGGAPVGTGPFKVLKQEASSIILARFEQYWGKAALWQTAVLRTFASRSEKIEALKNKEVDILANVPPDIAKNFQFKHFALRTTPSLEVNFLMFNFDKTFKSEKLRKAVFLALNTEELAKLVQGFASPASQFVGKGIFGYDPSLPKRALDVKAAEELVKEVSNFSRVSVTLDLPKGLEVFGAKVKEQLRKIGIDVNLEFLSSEELSKKISRRESEFFFFGWKSDLGDALDFLSAVAHSPGGSYGAFNGGNYRNSFVDRLIEISRETINTNSRLGKMREVMRQITAQDIIGVPLFSPEVPYAVSEDVEWQPRVDSYVLAQEVKM